MRLKTNACTTTDNNHCKYTISGNHIARLVDSNQTVTVQSHKNATFNKIEPADILPNNLRDNEIILAKIQIISNNHINIEITISPTLLSMSHFPVIGKYSWSNFVGQPSCFPCTYNMTIVAMIANATLNSSSPVAPVTFLNHHGKKNLMISLIQPSAFANKIIKNK